MPSKGQKRKGSDMSTQCAKSRLAQAAQFLNPGELVAKEDVVYECTQEGGKYVATVTLNKYDPNTGYQGLPAANQKQAEQNAAENCLKELKDVVEKLRSEH